MKSFFYFLHLHLLCSNAAVPRNYEGLQNQLTYQYFDLTGGWLKEWFLFYIFWHFSGIKMRIDRSKLKKSSSDVPADCKTLIDRLTSSASSNDNKGGFLRELQRVQVYWSLVPTVRWRKIQTYSCSVGPLENASSSIGSTSWTSATRSSKLPPPSSPSQTVAGMNDNIRRNLCASECFLQRNCKYYYCNK